MSAPDFLLRFPLHGSRLIEASAGTGKTFAIAALYVRLVLGHGGDEAAFNRPLLPPQILVMTFTEAATRELRDRIRARLTEAARHFRARHALASGESAPPAPGDDPVLTRLCDDYPPAEWPRCARLLEEAAEWMDEAAVATIHAWSMRMLREHAFDSGSLFHQQLEPDESELLAEAARDYWRTFILPRPADAIGVLFDTLGTTPDALTRRLGPLLKQPATGEPSPGFPETALNRQMEALAALKRPWREDFAAIQTQFEAMLPALNGTSYKPELSRSRLQAMHDWACDDGQLQPADPSTSQKDLLDLFSRATLRSKLKKNTALPEGLHSAFIALDDHADAFAPELEGDLLQHAAAWVARRRDEAKRRRAQLGYNDLITGLRDALTGPHGATLAATLRQQFPVALVDEFQDTDAAQYAIFNTIYRVADNDPDHGLLLIGDPKQAIYGFRGADIHTYLAARKDTVGRHATLDTNFRSTAGAVAAVNHLFDHANAHPAGPFLFRPDKDASDDDPLPFQPVAARGQPETLEQAGEPVAPLTLWHWPATEAAVTAGAYREGLAEACATAMVDLLQDGADGRCGFRGLDGFAPLRPRDMAVLVRSGTEAEAIRRALRERGVRSVYLSDRESVYATPEAIDLLHWLRACAEPESSRRLRAALATATLDRPLADLDRLNHDERHWEAQVLAFREYRRIWRQQGVLAMLHRLLHAFDLPRQLLQRTDGERSLTNLLHLSELLQQAAVEIEGEHALIRHLAEHCTAAGGSDDPILRLESDAALVRVVTIHKSKGLEYPLVFLPFICSYRKTTAKDAPLFIRDDHGTARPVFQPDDDAVATADRARLAEDLRLLYVATTRARHATWLGIAPVRSGRGKDNELHRNAFGYLLNGPEPLANDAVNDALHRLVKDSPVVDDRCTLSLRPLPQADGRRYRAETETTPPGPAREPMGAPRERWWIASYSALPRDDQLIRGERPPVAAAPETAEAEILAELVDDAQVDERPTDEGGGRADGAGLLGFPHGPGPGTFLHGLLEWAADSGFARSSTAPEALREVVARRCQRRGWTHWIEPLNDWLLRLLDEPLTLAGAEQPLRLSDLDHYQPELEFWLETHHVDARRLDRLVTEATFDGAPRPAMAAKSLNGLLKGFIDLAFCHEGRYYVADYKSNRIGPRAEDYAPEALRRVVLEHRYDLQGMLYTLALHRQLAARLPDYDYDRHMGGSVTLFLRGLDAPGQGVLLERPPRELIEQLDAAVRTGPDPREAP